MHKFIATSLIALSFTAFSQEQDVLTIDRVIPKNISFSFSNDKYLKPMPSDFTLENYVIMSNSVGERWAVLTLTNTSNGNRILVPEHILATFADGQQKAPLDVKLGFKGRETQSITVSFGESKFPMLSVRTES